VGAAVLCWVGRLALRREVRRTLVEMEGVGILV
jgi:hypothetical protein